MIVWKLQADQQHSGELRKLLTYQVSEKQWSLSQGSYIDSGANNIIRQAEIIRTEKLILFTNHNQILKDMQNCIFPTLKILNLSNNLIQSIEMISLMSLQSLASLNLCKSSKNISQQLYFFDFFPSQDKFKTIKINFDQYRIINADKNKLAEFEKFSQFDGINIKKLLLSQTFKNVDINQIPDANQLIKSKFISLQIVCYGRNSIFNQNLQTKLRDSNQHLHRINP